MFLNRILCSLICIVFIINKTLFAQNLSPSNSKANMKTKLIQPNYLKTGDTVAILAPSGVLNEADKDVLLGEKLLKSWGLNVVIGKHVFNKNGHFAGTDDERCEDFQTALDNPRIKAIWCARGGYGTVRILDKLDYTKYKKHPKWILGFSDITGLHNQLNILGSESIHTILCTSLTDDLNDIKESLETFKDAIFGKPLSYAVEGSSYNKTGSATGQLVGGNLTLLHTMLGSTTSLDTNGKILFFEETGEYAYHIDRMLQSLKRAGYFEHCKGIIVGDISKVRKNTTPFGKSIEELILDVFEGYNFPVLFNFPAGHEKDNRAMILGRTVELTVGKMKSTVVFEK
jgi:muramoyltetrapeptide carboxypeptidase